MSFKAIPFDGNMQIVYDLLSRAKKFHCPVGTNLEFDITNTFNKIRELKNQGHQISFVAFLIKATAVLIEKNPKLNQHLFHGIFSKKVVQFDDIICTTVIERKDETGKTFLLPLNIKNPHLMTFSEITKLIQNAKNSPISELKEFESFNKVRKFPLWALKFFSYKVRSDPKFYIKYFGTYGVSSLITLNSPGTSMNSLCNTGSAFIPGTIKDNIKVIKGEIHIRKTLLLYVMIDHFLMNGLEMRKVTMDLQKLIEDPEFLDKL